jgi:hypothetical protein
MYFCKLKRLNWQNVYCYNYCTWDNRTFFSNISLICQPKSCISWGDFSLFCLDSMRSTISAKSNQLCGDKVSLSDHPWMSSYIMQCVSWLWTVFWPSSDFFPGELKWRAILHGDLEQIANWVEAPRSSSKRPWSKGWNPLMFRSVGLDVCNWICLLTLYVLLCEAMILKSKLVQIFCSINL